MRDRPASIACATCGAVHPIGGTELVYGLPDAIFELNGEARTERAEISTDICMLDGARHFLRGVIPLPVIGADRPYRIGAWVEMSEDDIRVVLSLWEDESQSMHPPFNGRLANEIHGHTGSRGLKVEVRLTGPTTRPDIRVLPSGNDLYERQREGITAHEAFGYSERKGNHDSA